MNNEHPLTGRKPARKRGGQKNNRNARRHGFYSGSLDAAELCRFWNIVNLHGVPPEIAAITVKVQTVLQTDPGNRRLLLEASRILGKWYSAKFRLDRADSWYLNRVILHILKKGAAQFSRAPAAKDEAVK